MHLVLLLHLCLSGLGLCGAMPGRRFLMMFPPHNDHTANVAHHVTITATDVWTSVTVEVLESGFLQQIFLSAGQSKSIHLPLSVGMTGDHSSHVLSVTSAQLVTVLVSFCIHPDCEHSLLHDVSYWGKTYYPVTPHVSNLTAVSQMVITSLDHETSVGVFLSGDVHFNNTVHPRGSILRLRLGALQSVCLQSNTSLSGSEINTQQAVGVVVGFTCSDPSAGYCLYGFTELKPVSAWSYNYAVPPIVDAGVSSSFLLIMATVDSYLQVTNSTWRETVSLTGGVMKVIPVVTSDIIQVTNDAPLQVVYFTHDNGKHPSALTMVPSLDDICQAKHMFGPDDAKERLDVSQDSSTAHPSDDSPLPSIGHRLNLINKVLQQLYPEECEKTAAACDDLHCSPKRKCSISNGKPLCSLKTKVCSAWGGLFYRTFDGQDFILQGNCNYSLVQTTCSNASVPLQINIARAFLNGVSTIHTVQITILGFNISIVKDDKYHVMVDGLKRNLPLTLLNGSVTLYPSGSTVVLETIFGLSLQYDWKHHVQIEVSMELYGAVCGLCGNANHSSSDSPIASNATDKSQAVDFTLPWVVDSATGSCIEDCGGVSCAVCSLSQTKSVPGAKGDTFGSRCSLLQQRGGPFADCHSYVDPEPFVRSCEDSLCIIAAASSMCKVLTAYANLCQKRGAKVQQWRAIAMCIMACPANSHYEVCGPACPATCANPEAHVNCTQPCVESCQCNRGYLLSGGSCVPDTECGCVHQGSYYLPKESFWVDEHCQEKCTCQPNSKTVMCARSHCQDGEQCKVVNGVLGCHMNGPGVCIAKGDPHYTTFDGRKFDVHGNCTYILTSHCPTWGDLDDFSVEVQNQIKDATNVSFRHVKMVVSGYSIELSHHWRNRVMVNGLLMHFPSVLSRGKVKLYMTGLSKYVETDFGLIVMYSSRIVTVQMPRIFSGTLCGLCGNFNGNPEDDVAPDDDADIAQAVRYWQTNTERDCVDAPASTSSCNSEDLALYKGKEFCGRLLDSEGAFLSCHKTVDPQDFYDSCVYDLCYGNQTNVCEILSSYVALCQEMGATVDEWRTPDFCNLLCPPNSEYQLCSSHTSACTESPSSLKCKEGCFCRPGFFHSGGECVAESLCGCIYNGVYHEMHESFYPDEHCQLHCVCVGHNTVQCTNVTCPNGTKCAIKDGHRACHKLQTVTCTLMGGRHFTSYHGHDFDFSMGTCRYVLSQVCDQQENNPNVIIQKGQLHLSVYGINISLEMEHSGKVRVDGVLRGLPVHLFHVSVLRSGILTRVVLDNGVVVTYGGPNLIQIVTPAFHRKMCGLCGIITPHDKHSPNGSFASDISIFASSWSLSPPEMNCSEECHLCSACNSTMTAEFASDELCGTLLASAGSFSGCHSTVNPQPFFQQCVTDLCMSNGNEEVVCGRLREYTFACQEAGAQVKPWRGEKCLLSCPVNSHYNTCVDACPETCGILSNIPCPWHCYEGCQCNSGYMWSGNGCVRPEQCGCFHRGYYYEIGAISWTEGCSERCNCSAAATMCCEPASCPKGESCTLNNTWGCARKDNNQNICEDEDTCDQSHSPLSQCWVLGGAHFYTFDGQAFEFHGNCTYTLMYSLNDTSEENTFWVGVQKERTPNKASSVKAIHIKLAKDNISIFRGEEGAVWVNGEKKWLPVILQHGLVQIHQSHMLVVLETNQGIQVKYDLGQVATVLISKKTQVDGLCGNNNGIKEDDFRTPQGDIVDATTFGWSWRLHDQDAYCAAECGDSCPRCSARQLQEKNKWKSQFISLHEYFWSQQSVFYPCQKYVNYTKISTALSMFDLCSSNDTQNAFCSVLETYAAACRSVDIRVDIREWRNSSLCSMSCPLNSHYESCGTACPATCEIPFSSSPCTLACVQMCQCDRGFVLDGDTCVPLSQCGCTHNSTYYRSNQTFWADEECSKRCVCDPDTHRIQCHLDSCSADEYCGIQDGARRCVQNQQHTCVYSGHHIVTFDQHGYDLHGTCQYQLLGLCGHSRNLDAIKVHLQTDGHAESALHVLVNVNDTLVELNSKNNEYIEVNGVIRNLPFHFSPTALAFSLGMHIYIYTGRGFEFSLSIEGIVSIHLSREYANSTCGLCGNFNSDPTDDLKAGGTQEPLSPDQFAKLWRSGQNPWCVEGCLGGSCPKCSSERLARFSDPEACGKILEVNGPFRHCHGKVDPSSFYKRCISDLCLHGGPQSVLCHSLADYTAVCLSHKATVYAWRSPGFCYPSCPPSTSYNTSSASVPLCLGWQNITVEMPLTFGENCLCEAGLVLSGNICVSPENCGCFHQGEYLKAGQVLSTCEQSCLCQAGGHVSCHSVSCLKDEECTLIGGVQDCHPQPKEAHCSVFGSQYTTFDGRAFEFYGSCNYTLVRTCYLKKMGVDHVWIAAQGSRSHSRQIYMQINEMQFKISTAFPGEIQVNGIYEKLPFSESNITVYQKNRWLTIKAAQSIELISDLRNHILVKIPDIYHQTTCGLCGNYNGDPSDDLQLSNGTITTDPTVFGSSWKSFDVDSSCSDTCDGTCQICLTPVPEYTSDLYCGLLTHPSGPFSPCHHLVCPQKYYSTCMRSLCIAQGQRWALCDVLQAYEAACKEAGGMVDLWMNVTGCAGQCPQFSHYSVCANACSSLCPEMNQTVQCPVRCEEGCRCDTGLLYNGHACVPPAQCGCVQAGRSFKASESKLLQNCTVSCTCGPPLICEPHACPPQHSCMVLGGVMGCHKDEPHRIPDPCEEKCDETEKCYLSNGAPVCESRLGLCWAEEGQHYLTFDGLSYSFKGTCTYLLAASRGAACDLTPFHVSWKNDCTHSKAAPTTQVLTVQTSGFIIQIGREKGSIHVNGQVTYIPVKLLRGKIQVSHREGKTQLKSDFGLQVFFTWNSTVVITLDPYYKGKVYGLCGNFNGDSEDEYSAATSGSPPVNTSVGLAQVYQLFDGDPNCCTGCAQKQDKTMLLAGFVSKDLSSHRKGCAVLKELNGPWSHCHSCVDPEAFYQSCMHIGSSKAVDNAINLYSTVCEEASEAYHSKVALDANCPPNSHYKTCGSACPPSCGTNTTFCISVCVRGCFCNPGFIMSPRGCVYPSQCGFLDPRGTYHSLNSTFWIPDNCGQRCTSGPAAGEVRCSSDQCPTGMVCNQLSHKRVCQPEKPLNCTIVTGLHFTTFDGHHFDFRDSCTYSLVETNHKLSGVTPFRITISDASCYKRFSLSSTITLSVYGLQVVVRKDEPGKVLVDGFYKPLPYFHPRGHLNAYRTPSSLTIQTDVGLQLIVYNTGTLTIILPTIYSSAVSGLCGNANSDPLDDEMMPDEELAQNALEFAHSWRSREAELCRSSCPSRLKKCPAETQKLFKSSDYCGVLVNELGPFADCALVISPEPYFHSCVVDSCSHGGHYTAVCSSVASYVAACQGAQLPVRHWRSDTFCDMSCPKNSHYELCGPRCPVVCSEFSSPANCSGGCEEGCQCDPGYVLSDGHCVLASDCGCMHEGEYQPAGHFYLEKSCQKCNCRRGEVTCSPMESCSPNKMLAPQYGVCHVFAGFGYITFDGVVLPHHGACTYVLSALSSKALHDYTLLLSFKKDVKGFFTISRLAFHLLSLKVSIDPETLWKIQINEEDHSVPFHNEELQAHHAGSRLIIITPSGVKIELSSTQYIRLTIPQVDDATPSGLCGNFNGDRYDDLQLRSGRLANGFSDFLHSWTAPGQHCNDTCGRECVECSVSPHDGAVCDILSVSGPAFNRCWNSSVERHVYTLMCMRAVCAGAGHGALCLALEAYSASCQAKGIPVGPWRENTLCSFQCPERSSPADCVDSSSNSCPALLQPGSPAAGCAEGCQCSSGRVFDGGECVPYSQCGCTLHDNYIKTDELLYLKDCTQRCWCHPLGGVMCEEVSCSPGQQCALRNGSWGCYERPEVCELRGGLHVSTLSGQLLRLEPQLSYSLMSVCDEASVQWFSLISYHGPCDGSSSRLVTVSQILLHGMSLAIQEGTVKVNGHFVSLPHTLASGLTLSSGVNQDKSEVTVILRRDAGLESELQIDIGVTMVTVKVPLWYSGKLCGACGNLNDLYSRNSVQSWVLPDFPGCGFTG